MIRSKQEKINFNFGIILINQFKGLLQMILDILGHY